MISREGVESLLRSLNIVKALPDSRRGWHNDGLDYLCLHRDARLTVKLYAFRGCQHNEAGLIVWPHNHRYTFEHFTLAGKVENVLYREASGLDAPRWFAWDFVPGEQPKRRASEDDDLVLIESSRSDEPFVMTPEQIHSLAVPEDSIAIQIQYHDVVAPLDPTAMFSTTPTVDCSGATLYRPMDVATAQGIVKWARDALEDMP